MLIRPAVHNPRVCINWGNNSAPIVPKIPTNNSNNSSIGPAEPIIPKIKFVEPIIPTHKSTEPIATRVELTVSTP